MKNGWDPTAFAFSSLMYYIIYIIAGSLKKGSMESSSSIDPHIR
jgi:hypothetical protein